MITIVNHLKKNTCCFTGHRILPLQQANQIVKRLNTEIDNLICQGVTDFISGGALGFDQVAAYMVIRKRQQGENVRLIFALPCREQDKDWTADQQKHYRSLLSEADEVRYISEEYNDSCMKERNHHMVDNARHCICALLHSRSGTAQTIRYAQKSGLHIINVAE